MMLGVTHEIIRLFASGVSETPLGFAGGVESETSTLHPAVKSARTTKTERAFFIKTYPLPCRMAGICQNK